MKKDQIKVGGRYIAKVAGRLTTVRVDSIRDVNFHTALRVGSGTHYNVTNLKTGRRTTFRSAAKFRCEAGAKGDPIRALTAPLSEAQPADPTSPVSESVPSVDSSKTKECECGGMMFEEDFDGTCRQCGGTPPPDQFDPEGKQRSDPTSGATLAAQSAGAQHSSTLASVIATTEESPTTTHPKQLGNLASKIAACRTTHREGALIAGMVPNDEQEEIISTAEQNGLKVLVIAAGAGTGKTATLKMLEQILPGNGQYTAFNTSLVAESKAKFKKAACNTTHSLAFRAVGKSYQHRLGGERVQSHQIARILGIEAFKVQVPGQVDAAGNPKPKMLQAGFLAGQVMVAIRKFCQSADRKIAAEHLPYIDGIDAPTENGKRGYDNNNLVRDYLLPFCHKAWDDLTKVDGQLPFGHDIYVKLWQLGEGDDRPIISADYILLDEAQDTAPVFLDVIKQQRHALLVMVGDDNQQIYEWRGAVNAMGAFKDAPRRLLSQSYRFGQAVADVANAVLATLEQPTDLVMRGNPAVPSRVEPISDAPGWNDYKNTKCYLYRTNAGAITRIMQAIEQGRKPHLIGGGADVVAWCRAAMDLQARRGTRHPELACFDTWAEVVEYSKTDEGSELRLMVRLVEQFGAQRIHDALKDMPKEEHADLIACTAHKSKGREWDTVKLGPDFPLANKMNDADRRLLYVAATRAKLTLDITECPPFCGGQDKGGGSVLGESESRWVPGLEIVYTQPMPTKDMQKAHVPPQVEAPKPEVVTAPTNGNGQAPRRNGFSWYNFSSKWCLRGPAGATVGEKVEVRRKNGTTSTETIQGIVKKFNDAWIYSI